MRKKLLFISAILLGVVLLSACTGGARGVSWPGLSASGDVAYLADGPLVYAVNLKDGKELWHYPEKGGTKQVFYSTPVITPDGLVIVGSAGTDHSLVAITPTILIPIQSLLLKHGLSQKPKIIGLHLHLLLITCSLRPTRMVIYMCWI